MARRKQDDIERDWYGVFSRWAKDDRAAALRTLELLHENLPDAARPKRAAEEPEVEAQHAS